MSEDALDTEVDISEKDRALILERLERAVAAVEDVRMPLVSMWPLPRPDKG